MTKKSKAVIISLLIGLILFAGVKIGLELGIDKTKLVANNMDQQEQIVTDEIQEKKTEINTAKLLATGDIMFHITQIRASYNEDGKYDFNDCFKYVKKYISDADISIANYETVTAGDQVNYSGFPRFNSPEETLEAIKNTGFDIVSTANNHSLDQGKKGVIRTLDNAEKYGLKTIGTYREPQAQFLIEEKNGIKIGFLSYTYGLNGLDSLLSTQELSYMINLIDEEKIQDDIELLKDEVDLVTVSVHWGEEYQRYPNDIQIDLAHKMVNWGANIVLGSHPHVIQKSHIIKKDGKDNFIVYSMGNFISNQRQSTMNNSFTEDGVMIEITMEKDMVSNETIIKGVEFIPTWVDKYFENGKNHYRILPAKDIVEGNLDLPLEENIKNRIEKSYRDTLETLNQ